MVLPLLALGIAGAGAGAGVIGQMQGAESYQDQLGKELDRLYGFGEARRDSIRQALAQVQPTAQLDRARALAGRTARPQQDEAQAISRAYGMDNPALADDLSLAGHTIDDNAWQHAFGMGSMDVQHAFGDESAREGDINARQQWWQAFMPNRLSRAGDKGAGLRMAGQLAQAYGLGAVNRGMSAPGSGVGQPITSGAGSFASDALATPSSYGGGGSGFGGPMYWPINSTVD